MVITSELFEVEAQRCGALIDEDWDRLEGLLHPDLCHVHATGAREDRAGYLSTMRGRLRILAIEREESSVTLFGTTAYMSGILHQHIQRRTDGSLVDMTARVGQLWVRDTSSWRLAGFQATHIVQGA